jgi:nicotinamidase-related amidase
MSASQWFADNVNDPNYSLDNPIHETKSIDADVLAYPMFTRASNNPLQPNDKIGFIIVDVVAGFTSDEATRKKYGLTIGGKDVGYNTYRLAPNTIDMDDKQPRGETKSLGQKRCQYMIDNIIRTLQSNPDMPVLAFQDSHRPGQEEFPFPPHCVQGSEEVEIDPRLQPHLQSRRNVTYMMKDCNNGFINGFSNKFSHELSWQFNNKVVQWLVDNKITHVVISGICSDICCMQLTQGLINMVQHCGNLDAGQTKQKYIKLRRVYVLEPAMASYNIGKKYASFLANKYNIPVSSVYHPIKAYHDMAIKLMSNVGARIISNIRNV